MGDSEPRIAFIGAGSRSFGTSILGDVLSYPALVDSTIVLMDVDPDRLDRIADFARRLASKADGDPTIAATTDRREALAGADYVVTSFYCGWDAFEQDIRIPEEYGVSQAIGNMLNPSGVFAAQRNVPVILDVARDMEELCPDAPLLNYTNPVPALTWAVDEATDIDVFGLCHSVQGTARDIASYVDVPFEDLDYWAAGINHMSWFLEIERDGEDLYPRLHDAAADPETYRRDAIKFELLEHFGAFVSESSAHLSEYVPYFRTDDDHLEELVETTDVQRLPTGDYLTRRKGDGRDDPRQFGRTDDMHSGLEFDEEDVAIERSVEYGSRIIHSMETGEPRRMNINVRNRGAIDNLRDDAVVEPPCLVDGSGVHACQVGRLPPQLAALCRSNLDVYERSVTGALERDRTAVEQAVKLDPLTSAVCTLEEIREMTDRLFEASAEYLPEYA